MNRSRLAALAPVLGAIVVAEEISHDISARQAPLAPERLRRTLRAQAWQEAAHASIFGAALSCLPGRSACPPRVRAALANYATRLHADLDRGALAESMVGLHCVLEGVAAVALQPPPGELACAADALVPLRSFILHQEQAHQQLGDVWVPRLLADADRRVTSARTYAALAEALLDAALREFECVQVEALDYRTRVLAHLESCAERLRISLTFPAPTDRLALPAVEERQQV